MFQEALESRLRAIEEEITRLLRLSAEVSEPDRQDDYLRLAQDLQREARELRAQIKKETQPNPLAGREPRAKRSYFGLSVQHSQGLWISHPPPESALPPRTSFRLFTLP